MVPAMLGPLCPRAGFGFLVLYLVLAARVLCPQPLRPVLEELPASVELVQPLSNLDDDYGLRPRHPRLRHPGRPRPWPLFSLAQQRKRDGPDMADYYYEDARGD
ncbi:protein Frey 1 isoform X1 [Cavia porcellus]|uniref:Frey regulator of sperm-oocyte fusion 1 n=1 Tax=Cavia porcellus TaxID=10141 RepID=A0A286XNY3_CAVPO